MLVGKRVERSGAVEPSGAAMTKADIRGNRICWAGLGVDQIIVVHRPRETEKCHERLLGWAWTKS
jgi:hypothetical protein